MTLWKVVATIFDGSNFGRPGHPVTISAELFLTLIHVFRSFSKFSIIAAIHTRIMKNKFLTIFVGQQGNIPVKFGKIWPGGRLRSCHLKQIVDD